VSPAVVNGTGGVHCHGRLQLSPSGHAAYSLGVGAGTDDARLARGATLMTWTTSLGSRDSGVGGCGGGHLSRLGLGKGGSESEMV
jgi:hypothetical protein